MRRFIPDPFILSLLGVVALASLLPARGQAEAWVTEASMVALMLLFFLHGARLPLEAIGAGLRRPGLHAMIAGSTFVLFPVLGLGLHALAPGLLPAPLWMGVLFVCTLSSTVQSSIAFTSIAGGNVAAALCAATLSNLVGVVLTPVLVAMVLHRSGAGGGLGEIGHIMAQLLLPFAAGSALRPVIGGFVARHKLILSGVDRGSILLAVYAAFSEVVVQGIWRNFAPADLLMLAAVNGLLLAVVLAATFAGSRLLGLSREDEIAVVFCGSKKSLASGIPIATILFGASAGATILPIMIFHQMQLMVCAVLARRYAAGRLPGGLGAVAPSRG